MINLDVLDELNAAFNKLPLLPGGENELETVLLSLISFSAKGPIPKGAPENFRDVNATSSARQLRSLASITKQLCKLANQSTKEEKFVRYLKRLDALLNGLYQPSVLALAEAGIANERTQLKKLVSDTLNRTNASNLSEDSLALIRFVAIHADHACPTRTNASLDRSGRPRSMPASIITSIVLGSYNKLTGRQPTLSVAPYPGASDEQVHRAYGPALELLTGIFKVLGAKGSPEAAMRQWQLAQKKKC